MTPSIVGWLALAPMGMLLFASVWTDVKECRIPNQFVFSGLALGVFFNTVLPDGLGFASSLPGGVGLWGALAGAAIGLGVMLPLYLLRAMGAGDVKLMAMVGAFLGSEDVIGAVLCSFIAGGVLSLGYAWKIGVLRRTLQNIKLIVYSSAVKIAGGSSPVLDAAPETAGKFPYAVAIAVGTLGYLAWKSAQKTGWA